MFLKDFFEKVYFEKSKQTTTKAWKITQHAKGLYEISMQIWHETNHWFQWDGATQDNVIDHQLQIEGTKNSSLQNSKTYQKRSSASSEPRRSWDIKIPILLCKMRSHLQHANTTTTTDG